MIWISLVAAFLLVAMVLPKGQGAAETAETAETAVVTDWLRSKAIPLQTVEARHGFDDMRPIEKVVGQARLVALGEATHGTREFFQLKHRMLEFLATRMGFTVFAIEANMPEAYRLNDFVLHGKGDPKALLAGMYFWTWNTEEVLAMILWMREFNRSGKGRIEFTGFDMQTPDVAMGTVRGFVQETDSAFVPVVGSAQTALAQGVARNLNTAFGVATGTFPVREAAGKRVRYSGYVRTEGITRGWAGLWWRIDGQGRTLGFDNMEDRGPRGTTPWTKCEIVLDVPEGASNINFGVLHPGDGSAWFDGLRIELDDRPFDGSRAFDLDFESQAVRGFFVGGQGYRVELDSTVAHSGRRSLRSRWVEDDRAIGASDRKSAVRAWRTVLDHLESHRVDYGRQGRSKREIDWVIQNARIALQCAQMYAGEVDRDRCMADNVRWILEHSPPGTKMVLWAHNGHVAAGKAWNYVPMGAHLRESYGKDLVVFGFAFNRGSFRAVGMGNGLREFTVPPAPEGSFDAALAAIRLPLFAIDLRSAPRSGKVAEWLDALHPMRLIGAIYREQDPDWAFHEVEIRRNYDAILFVEHSTTARGFGRVDSAATHVPVEGR